MPREKLIDELTTYSNALISNTHADEYYYDYTEKFLVDLETLDRINDAEINALLVKCFQTLTDGDCVLDQAPPLLQALVYRRLKLLLEYYGDKKNKPTSPARAILLHFCLVEWNYLKGSFSRSKPEPLTKESIDKILKKHLPD